MKGYVDDIQATTLRQHGLSARPLYGIESAARTMTAINFSVSKKGRA